MLNGMKTSEGHYTSKLNGLRMIPTFLKYSQVMDVGEFFGIVVVHFEASVFRMDSDGSDEAHHSDPAQDLQHIERQDCPSS